jgi:hypothetical protein
MNQEQKQRPPFSKAIKEGRSCSDPQQARTADNGAMTENTVTCIPIPRQWLGERIPATHVHATIGSPLIDNSPVNTFPLKRVTIGSPLLSNGVVNRLRQQYRLCSPLGKCKVVIREANTEAGSYCRSIEQ